jgi:hypothetical protein
MPRLSTKVKRIMMSMGLVAIVMAGVLLLPIPPIPLIIN